MMPFTQRLFTFLDELAANNDRDWFAAHKERYERDVREPALAFVRAVGEQLPAYSEALVASDKKVGGSLMRIHRDVRFSKDKSPYKANVGIQFRHRAGKDVHAPGVYVHLAPDEVFLGAGIYAPKTAVLTPVRQAIVDDPDRWTAITAALAKTKWRQAGESLRRAPKGFDKDHPLVDDLRRKSFILVHDLKPRDATRKAFAAELIERLAATRDYVAFVCEALELDF